VEQLVQLYKALSEEMRLRIMMLLTHGELCVCDLMEIFGEAQSKVSRHLAYLKHSGLVKSKRDGLWMHYSLREPMDSIAQAQISFLKEQLSCVAWFQEDMKKMEEVKKQKLCETTVPEGTKSRQTLKGGPYSGR
jgi:ArsR family transcriptional regulator, arsenate/arsenite/antimonite-responsive transcriptional repressor